MGLTVGDLAGLEHLGITVLAGRDGLDRDVEWAHVCELEDPTPWMDGAGDVLRAASGHGAHRFPGVWGPDLDDAVRPVHPGAADIGLPVRAERRHVPASLTADGGR